MISHLDCTMYLLWDFICKYCNNISRTVSVFEFIWIIVPYKVLLSISYFIHTNTFSQNTKRIILQPHCNGWQIPLTLWRKKKFESWYATNGNFIWELHLLLPIKRFQISSEGTKTIQNVSLDSYSWYLFNLK